MRIAPGKAAEAAARGKTPPQTASFFLSGLARPRRARPEGKKEEIILGSQPQAALRLPGAILILSLRDFSLARCARIMGERGGSGTARLRRPTWNRGAIAPLPGAA